MIILISAAAAILIFIIYLSLIKPGPRRRSKISPFAGVKYFAHRGLWGGEIKENTARAFSEAVKHGYGVEFDIRLSSDGVPVVIHDATLKRVFGIDKKVCETPSDELFAAGVPSLCETLDIIGEKAPIIAEIKADDRDVSVCAAADAVFKKYGGFYCVESFNPLALMWYKKRRPEIYRGQLSTKFIRDGEKGGGTLYFILERLLLNFLTSPDFISYRHIYRSEPSFYLCRRLFKTPAAAWTVRSAAEVNECEKDFDAFIFESFLPQK